jgi:leucyl/phenylalanyl-tRNA---protein transferase
MIRIPMLKAGSLEDFPPVEMAMQDPNGLLCAGADLSVERLLRAYRRGIFPWFNPGEPILWWSPDPRCVFDLQTLRPARSLQRFSRRCGWTLSADRAFEAVIDACAAPRTDAQGTWISAEMRTAYVDLHRQGHAHSVEVWQGEDLVGGIYGIAQGRLFFGESMFSRRSNGSKIALFALARQLSDWGFVMIDGQVHNPHLMGLGAIEIPRRSFVQLLDRHGSADGMASRGWSESWTMENASEISNDRH